MARWTGHTRLDPARALAHLLSPRPGRAATLAGSAAHLAAGSLLFPTAYALLFEAARRADAPFGLAIGAVHGTLAGLALPLAHRHRDQEPAPGLFGHRLGTLTPPGLLAAHLLYGALLGHIYVVP
ncbi:MAG TPA: hypothetical protein VNK43_03465 [Gemmatimonadales bacterium]|nr:hypothetical protein [Gemmatimonadales bacterium]